MKKNLIYIFAALLLLLSLVIPVTAADYPSVYDSANLLSDSEEESLNRQLEEIYENQHLDVAIATFDTIGYNSIVSFANDFYDDSGYGYGANHDGLILVIVMDTHDWYISTCGYGIQVFTDAGINYIGSRITPYMSEGDFVDAFEEFASLCSKFIAQAESGDPYDYHNLPREPFAPITTLIISAVVGLVVALLHTARLKRQLKTVKKQTEATKYMKDSSMVITESKDLFLYRHVSKIPKANSSSSSGGSRTHTSSSGRSHGGGGGKF